MSSVSNRGVLRMSHEDDPREKLTSQLGDISEIEIFNNQILVALYERPEKTAAGLFLPDKTRQEDQYQGKVGLVVKKGPLAFENDARNDFQGQTVEIGDWIVFRVQDAWPLAVNGPKEQVKCRMMEDVHVRLRISSPDDVY
ncbi:hypothetical protein ACELLULO517_07725 [Acidisoma cellulosilytica]|uniref:10 kDa chaperonin n=1 Tax=Acidisoma cellulosilyticum TaxID=2802395 RepID=A0A963YZV6_9PROT|nr:hypothetical protein [Acidisoma cellulosilyticum]MCB8880120.1 hypothetical protein [Acidisoma cellulosilyticum]